MAEQTFADFIVRERQRLHAEREQISTSSTSLKASSPILIASWPRLMRMRPPRPARLLPPPGNPVALERVRKLVAAASAKR
jgi:hypothetical protein